MSNSIKSLEKATSSHNTPKVKWASFVEADVVNFFNAHELEKMSIEDGDGNKAKLARQKDNSIKVEYSTTTIL
jgi:hypothetical protein